DLLQVATAAEHGPGTGEDRDRDVPIALDLVERRQQACSERDPLCVALLRPIQDDPGDLAVLLDDDFVAFHGKQLLEIVAAEDFTSDHHPLDLARALSDLV